MENTIYIKEEKPAIGELEGNIQHEDMEVKIEKPDIREIEGGFQEENINVKIEIPIDKERGGRLANYVMNNGDITKFYNIRSINRLFKKIIN